MEQTLLCPVSLCFLYYSIFISLWGQQFPWYFVLVVVQLLSCVWLFATPCTAARQSPLSFTICWSVLKFCVSKCSFKNRKPFLKSLLNVLQYCFCFTVFGFLTTRCMGSQFPGQGLNDTPCIGRWSSNHWTAKELPVNVLKVTGFYWFMVWFTCRFLGKLWRTFKNKNTQAPMHILCMKF